MPSSQEPNSVTDEALKKTVLESIRRHNLAIDDDDPVTELAVLHRVLFDQHVDAVQQLLHEHHQTLSTTQTHVQERTQHIFQVLTQKLQRIRLTSRLSRQETVILWLILFFTGVNSVGIVYVVGKILQYW